MRAAGPCRRPRDGQSAARNAPRRARRMLGRAPYARRLTHLQHPYHHQQQQHRQREQRHRQLRSVVRPKTAPVAAVGGAPGAAAAAEAGVHVAQYAVPRRRPERRLRLVVHAKQYVPSDGFGGISPERKAANHLRTLFTFVAVKIVLAQLEGSGRGALGAYNQTDYEALSGLLQDEPFRDGDEWLAKLMRKNSLLAVRVLEVREAYCEEDFEYDQLERLARKDMRDANVRLMRSFASSSFGSALAEVDSSSSKSDGERGTSSGTSSSTSDASGGGGGGRSNLDVPGASEGGNDQ